MKIRLAKKIMKYKSIVDEYNNGDGSVCDGMKESYWLKRMFDHISMECMMKHLTHQLISLSKTTASPRR